MDSIEIMLKEYETLRQESLTAMGNRMSILSFGLAAIGAILAAGIATYTPGSYSPLSSLFLILLVPAITNFTLFMWLGEYQRMQRAGSFLARLEHRINEKAKEPLLTWETELRKQRHHMRYPYNTTVLLLMIISVISLIIGIIILGLPTIWIWISVIVGVIIHLLIYIIVVSSISKLSSAKSAS